MKAVAAALAIGMIGCRHRPPPSEARVVRVDEQFHAQYWMLKDCYNVALGFDPKSRGKLNVQVHVASDGSVADARPICSSASPLLTTCTAAAVRSMRFDPPEPAGASATFTVPIRYSLESRAEPDECPAVDAAASDARADDPDDVVVWNGFRLRQCIDQATSAHGVARVRVDIDREGVPHPGLACSTAPPSVTACIVDAFAAMRFAKSAAGRSFVTPVVVSPKSDGAQDCQP